MNTASLQDPKKVESKQLKKKSLVQIECAADKSEIEIQTRML